MVLLSKGNELPDIPSSFHPLCMLDLKGKNMKWIRVNRLKQYRKGKYTIDALERVRNIAKEAHDGLLKLELPANTTMVSFADDVAVVLVAKHLKELQAAFSTTIRRIRQWMRSADLSLAEHKTEALLVSSRKKMETIAIRVGDHNIPSPFQE